MEPSSGPAVRRPAQRLAALWTAVAKRCGLVQVPIKTKEMDGKIKRTPSGAELSATLGLTVKKSLGLDNKSRKVKIRGLI